MEKVQITDVPTRGEIDEKIIDCIGKDWDEIRTIVDEQGNPKSYNLTYYYCINPEEVKEYLEAQLADIESCDPNCPYKFSLTPGKIRDIHWGIPCDYRLDLSAWRPFEYPIFKCDDPHVWNVMPEIGRYIITQKPQTQYRLPIHSEFIEGILFEGEIPESVTLEVSGKPFTLTPIDGYLYLGMIPMYCSQYNEIYILFGGEYSFGVIHHKIAIISQLTGPHLLLKDIYVYTMFNGRLFRWRAFTGISYVAFFTREETRSLELECMHKHKWTDLDDLIELSELSRHSVYCDTDLEIFIPNNAAIFIQRWWRELYYAPGNTGYQLAAEDFEKQIGNYRSRELQEVKLLHSK